MLTNQIVRTSDGSRHALEEWPGERVSRYNKVDPEFTLNQPVVDRIQIRYFKLAVTLSGECRAVLIPTRYAAVDKPTKER